MRFLSSTFRSFIFTLLALFCAALSANAQTDISSPYSLFGPGIPTARQSVTFAGMGGSGVALSEPYRLNIANPALQAYLLDPVFEIGGRGTFSTYRTNLASVRNNAFSINNIGLSFPIKRNVWALSIGVVPFTTVGYDVISNSSNVDPELSYVAEYEGSGGISQAYIGTGYKIWNKVDSAKNVSSIAFGVNMNYNFGTIENNRKIYFPNDPTRLGFAFDESILVRDVSFNAGLHYHGNIIKRSLTKGSYLKFMVGVVYDAGSNVRSQLTNTAYNFRASANGLPFPRDTLASNDGTKGTLTIPTRLTVGVAFDFVTNQRQRLRLAADYSVQQWSDFALSFDNSPRDFNFRDSEKYSGGIEFTPSYTSLNLLKRIEYRAGFKYEKTSLNLRDTEIDDYGISFGLSVPFHYKRGITQSTFNISTEYGRYGTTNNGLIEEDYLRLYVGFSFTPNFRNKWFIQPKYD